MNNYRESVKAAAPLNQKVVFVILLYCIAITIAFGAMSYLNLQKATSHFGLSECLNTYSDSPKIDYKSISEIRDLIKLCNEYRITDLEVEQGNIRVDDLIFQRRANEILLVMVVGITFAGVVLAGMQLLASYILASKNLNSRNAILSADVSSALSSGVTQIDYGKDNVSFRSSVIGLSILAVSFAFFLVYVFGIYKELDQKFLRNATGKEQMQTTLFTPYPSATNTAEPQKPSVTPTPGSSSDHEKGK